MTARSVSFRTDWPMYNIEAGKSWSDLPQVRKKHQYLTSETSTDIRFFNVKARSNSIAKLKGNSAWDPVLTQIASAPDRQTDEQTTHTIEEVWRAYFYYYGLKNLNNNTYKVNYKSISARTCWSTPTCNWNPPLPAPITRTRPPI